MLLMRVRSWVTRRPGSVAMIWVATAVTVGLSAPNLTRLAAEGQAHLLGSDTESVRAGDVVRRAWPDGAYVSLAVVALHRAGGLESTDLDYAKHLAERIEGQDRPAAVLRTLGPGSPPEVASRLLSRDGSVALVVVPLSSSFVAPANHESMRWLELQTSAPQFAPPEGLEARWTGDAMMGRDYMANVQTSLHRAAAATVILLLVVLLVVYCSVWLALVPLITIGISLVIARGILAWLCQAGWEVSSLVELFLVALLFGSGTDFCLLVSWRFGEDWDDQDPARAMRIALERSSAALLTSAGTVIVGLSLMGTTRFKLFSSTGPSVALGLAITLAATLTLTPALLVMLARVRPRAFAGLTAPSWGLWERLSRAALGVPILSWLATVLVMLPLTILGLRSGFVQDVMTEMPEAASVRNLRWLASKFDTGALAPLTVILESDSDLRSSVGLALIDEVSRFLGHQHRLLEVRSATQPLGRTTPLEPARISERFRAVDEGVARIEAGARQLQNGLNQGAAKLRAVARLEEWTGLSPTGASAANAKALASSLKRAWAAVRAASGRPWTADIPPPRSVPDSPIAPRVDDPRGLLSHELTRAADGAGRLAAGALDARREVASILQDPVGRRALNRLLITPETIRDHPELLQSFDSYITPDGRRARVDVTQSDRLYSGAAMDRVDSLRRRMNVFLGNFEDFDVKAQFTGANAESADIRALIRSDQIQSWYVVPAGVFLVLLLTLRDPLACLNLVGTMLLTYAFALGATHVLFVSYLGAAGIDWKVPYFLFVILVAAGVDFSVFLMTRVREESHSRGLRIGIARAVGQTGGLISSAAAIIACSFASFLFSPLGSLRQLGFALVVGITVDAVLVRPLLVPCGHWLLKRPTTCRERPTADPIASDFRCGEPLASSKACISPIPAIHGAGFAESANRRDDHTR
jgi:putative drug exporter of the RND superfamily